MSRAGVSSPASADVVYRSQVRVVPGEAKLKLVYLPHEVQPVPMGVHGPIAAHYEIQEGTFTPHAATLDYIVGAAAACLMGTFNGALQARHIATDNGRLTGAGSCTAPRLVLNHAVTSSIARATPAHASTKTTRGAMGQYANDRRHHGRAARCCSAAKTRACSVRGAASAGCSRQARPTSCSSRAWSSVVSFMMATAWNEHR